MELTLLLDDLPCPACSQKGRMELFITGEVHITCGFCKSTWELCALIVRIAAIRDMAASLAAILPEKYPFSGDKDTQTRRNIDETGKS